MTRLLSKSLLIVGASILGALVLAGPLSHEAAAQVIVDVPEAEFLATVDPVYFEGHAAYWWHNHWMWRDTVGWHAYDHEPAFLAQRRLHDPPGRWFYGPHDVHGGGYYGHDERGGHGGHEEHPAAAHEEHPAAHGEHGGGHEHH